MSALADFGIITIATGDVEYQAMAKALARSLEHAGVRLPRAVVVDRKHSGLEAFFHHVIEADHLPRNFQSKLHLGPLTPFARTLFMDVDCLVYEQFHSYLHQALTTPLCAPAERIEQRDWLGVTPSQIEAWCGQPRGYSLLHSGLFAFERERGGELLAEALAMEPRVMEAFSLKRPVSADVLLSIACAMAGLTEHWAKDPSFMSPSQRWSGAPVLDIARRSARTHTSGRACSSRIVHFMGPHKSGRTYRSERQRLETLWPRCDLRVSVDPETWQPTDALPRIDYHLWSVRDGARSATSLGRAALLGLARRFRG